MSKSSFKFKANKPTNTFQGFKMLKHQVRMEVVAKNGMKKLDVGHILNDLMQKANEKEKVSSTSKANHSTPQTSPRIKNSWND